MPSFPSPARIFRTRKAVLAALSLFLVPLIALVLLDWIKGPPQPPFTKLASEGLIGASTSIAIGADGRALISFRDERDTALKVAHCRDLACTRATVTTLDGGVEAGGATSIAIGSDGLGLIAYADPAGRMLRTAHCSNVECTSARLSTVGRQGLYLWVSLVIGRDGLGLMAYGIEGRAKVSRCVDTVCSAVTSETVDAHGGVDGDASIVVGPDGLPLLAYYTHSRIQVAHCRDDACDRSTISNPTGRVTGLHNAMTLAPDGLALISSSGLETTRCLDPDCSAATYSRPDAAGEFGWFSSIAIGADGLPLIAHYDFDDGDLRIVHCSTLECGAAAATATAVDSEGNVGRDPDIAIGADGLALISYWDISRDRLKVAHCSNLECTRSTVAAPGR